MTFRSDKKSRLPPTANQSLLGKQICNTTTKGLYNYFNMPTSKVILLTGASRGIGLAAAKFLLEGGHRLVVVARTAGPLEELKGGFPGKVEVVVGDAAGDEVSPLSSLDRKGLEYTRTDMKLPGLGSSEGGIPRAQLLLATRRPHSQPWHSRASCSHC